MSLAPREQRLLVKIEHSLRSSDPRLAHMLATFTLPAFRGGIQHLFRLRVKDFVPPALAIMAIGLIIVGGLLLGRPSRADCGLPGARTIAAGRLSTCQAAGGTARPLTPAGGIRGL
jgi:Protein of unknown function (DUF3040)